MILTLKVTLSRWHAVLEVDSATTLEGLHVAIQDAVKFDEDHMFEFFIARTVRSSDRIHFDIEDGNLDSTRVADLLPLPKDRKLFYLFDYGDEWVLRVSKTRRQPFEPDKGYQIPTTDRGGRRSTRAIPGLRIVCGTSRHSSRRVGQCYWEL